MNCLFTIYLCDFFSCNDWFFVFTNVIVFTFRCLVPVNILINSTKVKFWKHLKGFFPGSRCDYILKRSKLQYFILNIALLTLTFKKRINNTDGGFVRHCPLLLVIKACCLYCFRWVCHFRLINVLLLWFVICILWLSLLSFWSNFISSHSEW